VRVYCRKHRLNIKKKTQVLLNDVIKTGLDPKPNIKSHENFFHFVSRI